MLAVGDMYSQLQTLEGKISLYSNLTMVCVPTCVPDMVLALCVPGQCQASLRMYGSSFMKVGVWRVMIFESCSCDKFSGRFGKGGFFFLILSYLALTKVPGNHISGESHSEIFHIVGLVCLPTFARAAGLVDIPVSGHFHGWKLALFLLYLVPCLSS